MATLFANSNFGIVEIGHPRGTLPPDESSLPIGLRCLEGETNNIRYTLSDLRKLKSLGYYTVGAGLLLYDNVDGNPSLLIAKHKPSDKHPNPVWSIPTETTQYAQTEDGNFFVESGLSTAYRNLREELELPEPPLLIQPETAWVSVNWPLGADVEGERLAFVGIFALCMPFALARVVDGFKMRTDNEIEQLRLLSFDELHSLLDIDLRHGFLEMVTQLMIRNVQLMGSDRRPFFGIDNLFFQSKAPKLSDASSITDEHDCTNPALAWHDLILTELPDE